VPDRSVPVDADADQGERAEEDGDGLGVADERAQRAAEGPVLEKNVSDERERHADGRHQRVGARQVQDEPVRDGPHAPFSDDDSDDERVTTDRDDDDNQVENNEQDARVDRKQVRVDDRRRVTVHRRRRVVVFMHDCSGIFCFIFHQQKLFQTDKIQPWLWSCKSQDW